MRAIGNVLWLLLVGWHTALEWLLLGLLLCLPIVTVPFAIQCFKIGAFSLWPFGLVAVRDPAVRGASVLGNILWFLPGLFIALVYFLGGVLLCLTIIGIPFGIQAFKLAGLALVPFGRSIVPDAEARRRRGLAPGAIDR